MRYRYLRYPEGRTKAVTFSYDDGSVFDKRLVEIFDKYGVKATFNIGTSTIESKNSFYLSKAEIKEYIIDRAHELAVHGEKHVALTAVSPIDAIKEVLFGRLGLEETFDITVRGMAYPDAPPTYYHNGNTAEGVKRQLADLGIAYSRSAGEKNEQFRLPNDWYIWMPTAHHDDPAIFEYIDSFLALDVDKRYCSARWPRLFYVWGHSFEFDRKNNWERIEEICEKLSGKDDTWYATNIEIYDYVKAYESLIISADGTRVYNPTLIKVWFDVDGTLFSVAPGEHIRVSIDKN